MDILRIVGRSKPLFQEDITCNSQELGAIVSSSRFLVLGGAGSIGQAVVKEIFKRKPKKLVVVDLSENNLAELVRDIRSSMGYIDGDFRTFALDIGSSIYKAMMEAEDGFDYVLNLSALKHVRSERDPYTLMRMIDVNITNTIDTLEHARSERAKKYFCVSTDKAANPANMMGASKRIMEMFLLDRAKEIPVSTARFANVAFSNGSLLMGFQNRILKRQPLAAPKDIQRYFVTPEESGQLCLMSTILGRDGEIFFPKPNDEIKLTSFSEVARRFLESQGFEPIELEDEEKARKDINQFVTKGQWPCVFSNSDTTGEKPFEEFYTDGERIDLTRFSDIGIVENAHIREPSELSHFISRIEQMKSRGYWMKSEIVAEFQKLIPNFSHQELGKNLDQKM